MRPLGRDPREVRQAVGDGAREVQLLGQIVNHYQAPGRPGVRLRRPARAVNEIPGVERIRFASPHPRHVTPRMIAAVRDLPEGLQAPAPAGAVGLDARPGVDAPAPHARAVPRAGRRLREAMPDIALSTDMIVGFPGRPTPDFEETLSLTEPVRYHSMFSFKYSRAAEHAGAEADARRRAGGGEDAADRRAAGAAARDPARGDARASVGRRSGAGGLAQPPARVGAVGAHERQHRREFPGRPEWIGRFLPVRITAGPNSLRGEAVAAGAVWVDTGSGGHQAPNSQFTDRRRTSAMQIEMTSRG
jgi:tRNA-2-methylthio-N6-dimethylallyladenosine synthase